MNFEDFRKAVRRTMNPKLSTRDQLSNWCMGLAGESGEAIEIFKKALYHGKEIDHENVKKELGDVLFYVAALCTTMGICMDEVAELNVAKLLARYPDGFVEHKFRSDLPQN